MRVTNPIVDQIQTDIINGGSTTGDPRYLRQIECMADYADLEYLSNINDEYNRNIERWESRYPTIMNNMNRIYVTVIIAFIAFACFVGLFGFLLLSDLNPVMAIVLFVICGVDILCMLICIYLWVYSLCYETPYTMMTRFYGLYDTALHQRMYELANP